MKRFVAGIGVGLLLGVAVGMALAPLVSSDSAPPYEPAPSPREQPSTTPRAAESPRDARRRQGPPTVGPRRAAPPEATTSRTGEASRAPHVSPIPHPFDFPGQTAEQLLARLEQVVAGLSDEDAAHLVGGIATKDAELEIPVHLTLQLLAASRGAGDLRVIAANNAVATWSERSVRDGLERALDTSAEGSGAYAELAGSMVVRLAQVGKPSASDLEPLLAGERALVRRAGVLLAQLLWPFPLEQLAPLAGADPDDLTRSAALGALLKVGLDGHVEALGVGRKLALDAARHGEPATRRAAIEHLPELGPAAADVALSLLAEAALPVDERNAAVATVMRAGRLAELLRNPSPAHLDAVGEYIWDTEDVPGDAARLLAPHLPRLVDGSGGGDAGTIFMTFCEAGAGDAVAAYAADRSRRVALRGSAIEALLDIDVTKAAGLEIATDALVADEPAALRRRVVEALELAYYGDYGTVAERRRKTLALLETVVRDDADYWVRATAHDVLETLRAYGR